MTPVVIAFGSNVGDREGQIRRALRKLESAVIVEAVSGLYETAPMYDVDQPDFLNGIATGLTLLGPTGLVRALKRIESEVGREAVRRNGPREIDLDLVLYGQLILRSVGSFDVQVPHPRLHERRFVLEPLYEVVPDAFVPGFGPVETLLENPTVQAQSARRVADARVPLQGPERTRA
ncbi:MAG TPA: 2-amino-4-hydroxy-6-hydroxymethyldihydropteridine diphosphokinase [Fimbriimonadaceae bacterium]|nr:2-amino-4-hydroxy-6-hydroxymethyldihydropteridine diphosphokinase [Fimbriimonadaceae bacterium]